jgi:bifunctional UDP-N-acetylglucosamine pyrophosphorylase / glucosamine-1-phosphate N-acetyltransferase
MSPFSNLEVVVLAAGLGTRMYSARPKVLQPLAGRCLLEHVVATAKRLDARAIHVVYGHGGDLVPTTLKHLAVRWVLQAPQKGTGHALQQALPQIGADAVVLVLYGDVPLTRVETLRPLLTAAAEGSLALLTMELEDAGGYGRIVRGANGEVRQIVEHKDATLAQQAIAEINTGILAAPAKYLHKWLAALKNDNAQGEYYLTDIVAIAAADSAKIKTAKPAAAWEIMGVNSKNQLAELERILQRNQAQALMQQGVTFMDPARFDLRGTLTVGADVVIDVNVVIEGTVRLGNGVHIGPNNVIRDTSIGDGAVIHPNCVIENAQIGDACRIGPFARIRPGARLDHGAHIGNFVEIKNAEVGEGSKINHLSYVGDSVVGKNVNIGAGVITCNYDGADKHRTVIGDDAFIGSDCQLVAPVKIGAGATIGAGSTITTNTPPNELTLSRVKQKTVTGWKRPVKKRKD